MLFVELPDAVTSLWTNFMPLDINALAVVN